VALWRKAFGCGQGRISEHWLIRANTVATNIVWDNCSGGRKVALDVHSGGHFIPEHWLGIQLDELMGRE
jgi:polyhydroxybutyrate depolymerase